MRKRKYFLLPVILLILSLLLSACQLEKRPSEEIRGTFFAPDTTAGESASAEETTEKELSSESERPAETKTEEPSESTEKDPEHPKGYTPYWEYERRDEAYLKECPFDEIEYVRPDTGAMIEAFAELQALAEADAPAEELIEAYRPIDEDTTFFSTMESYANIRYTLNLSDSYFEEEYNWCEEQQPLLSQAEEKCFIAMAESSARDQLEEDYFGEGFFEYYDEHQVYSNDRVVELMQQEADLQQQYMALQNNLTIEWDGEETPIGDIISDPDLDFYSYMEAIGLYYDKYNGPCADIMIRLIKVRNAMAEELGYESYADFAYPFYFERDYTPEDVKQYLRDIEKYMGPYYFTAASCEYSQPMETDEVMELLGGVAHSLGREFATAYDYMIDFNLYDITASTSKMPGSYMTYLPSYEMPFMYVSPDHDIGDFMTAAHEFGHFTDGYVNCGDTTSIDCNEIFSQALEYLSINASDLDENVKKALTQSHAAEAVMVFLNQACYADFESRIYEIPEEELSAGKLNQVFTECCQKYLYVPDGAEELTGPGWFEIQHFFIAPQYVISYCISLDAALQVYETELKNGDGVDVYFDLLSKASGNSILALLEEADLASPFRKGRVEELSEFLYECMN